MIDKLDNISKEKILSLQIGERQYEFPPPIKHHRLKDDATVLLKKLLDVLDHS